jgi:Flp pilus assembly pilin Flp
MFAYLKKQVMDFMKEEEGVGVIEVVLILVVLIGLVIIFKDRINAVLELTFKQIDIQSKEVY